MGKPLPRQHAPSTVMCSSSFFVARSLGCILNLWITRPSCPCVEISIRELHSVSGRRTGTFSRPLAPAFGGRHG